MTLIQRKWRCACWPIRGRAWNEAVVYRNGSTRSWFGLGFEAVLSLAGEPCIGQSRYMLDIAALALFFRRHQDELSTPVKSFSLGPRDLDFVRHRYVMGVVNLSPDSIYTRSVVHSPEQAIEVALQQQAQGAAFVDLGAESSAPGTQKRDAQEQLDLLLPVVTSLRDSGLIVSIESYYPEVLEACASAGAHVFNVTGNQDVKAILRIAGQHDCGVVLCYVPGRHIRDGTEHEFHQDFVPEMLDYFRPLVEVAKTVGATKLFVDPAAGFYWFRFKNLQQPALRIQLQYRVFLSAFRFRVLGFPVLNQPPSILEVFGESHQHLAEPFFSVFATLGGTHVIRTHEVSAVSKYVRLMTDYAPTFEGSCD